MRSRPQSFGQAAKPELVVQQLRYFESQFAVADDTFPVTRVLRQLLTETTTAGKQVHDANIVATMLVYDVPALLTHNTKDFQRFDRWVRLETLA